MSEPEWTLWYWPGIKGRGEYIRLIFEEAGVPYVDAGVKHGFQAVIDWTWQGGNTGFPVRAPPAVVHGDYVVCNTPAIQAYLGKKFGLYPQDAEQGGHVDQLLAIVTDAVAEGRLAFHPKDFYASHKTQVEESKPYVEQYGKQRLPKYMEYFESLLARNQESGFLVGDKLTVADLAVYHYLAAAQQHYGQYYDAQAAPLCKAFQARVAARPRIAAYLASDRCLPWDADSMM